MQSRSDKNIKGIDISNWQQEIDFKKVKDSGKEVVIIKATEGVNFVDKSFERHYKNAKAAGLKVGMYHFMSDRTNPTEQARDFWNQIKDKKFDIIPVLDIESSSRNKKEVTDRCLEFLDEFKRLSGYDCIIYTYTSFAKTKLDNRLSKYLLWIAHYGVNVPGGNGIWDTWAGFQYTDNEKVEGVKGVCDANEFTNYVFINRNPNPIYKPVKNKLWELSINGEEVKSLQREINNQFNKNLKVDGYFGENTLNACVIVKKGAKGNLTKLIQKRLISIGYNLKPYFSDGILGETTENAIKNFQKNKGLVVDGIVGKETWKALYSK